MSNGKILLTGAFGNVGANTIAHLAAQGYEIVCFDLKTDKTAAIAQKLAKQHKFEVAWGDLRDPQAVEAILAEHEPDAILHVAAVIAPVAFVIPAVAEDVNVNGTCYLVKAAQQLQKPPKFIFVSSYAVYGSRNPHRNLPPLTADTPINPLDTYARHKVEGERIVRESGLDWTILRLPGILPTDQGWGTSPVFLKFQYLLSLDQRFHVLDSRDVGLALTNAIAADTADRTFLLGGPAESCQIVMRDFLRQNLEARGLRLPAENAYRHPAKDLDEAWDFNDFVDPTESQAALKYQQHDLADHLALVRESTGWLRYALTLFGPLIQPYLVRQSPTAGKPIEVDNRLWWDIVCETFAIPEQYR